VQCAATGVSAGLQKRRFRASPLPVDNFVENAALRRARTCDFAFSAQRAAPASFV